MTVYCDGCGHRHQGWGYTCAKCRKKSNPRYDLRNDLSEIYSKIDDIGPVPLYILAEWTGRNSRSAETILTALEDAGYMVYLTDDNMIGAAWVRA